MDWIESHKAIMYHRKTGRLMRALSMSRLEAVGMVHGLWWWCVDNAPDGDLNDVDPQDIADWCCWPGDATGMLSALRQSEWITEDGYIHDWDDFAGKLIDRQVQDKKRKRDARLKLREGTSPDSPQEVQGTSTGHPVASRAHNRTLPYPTEPNLKDDTPLPPLPENPRPAQVAEENFQSFFRDFLEAYPPDKDGKKPGGVKIEKRARAIKVRDRDPVVIAAKHYAQSEKGVKGYVVTPDKFLDGDYWKEYIEPVRSNGNGSTKQPGGNRAAQAALRNFEEIARRRSERLGGDADYGLQLGSGQDTP